jgi:hypothetical protein
VKEEGEEVFVFGKEVPEEGGHKWRKKNVRKMQPAIPATKPVLAARKRKRLMHKKRG